MMADEYIRRAEALELQRGRAGITLRRMQKSGSFPPPTLRRCDVGRCLSLMSAQTPGFTARPASAESTAKILRKLRPETDEQINAYIMLFGAVKIASKKEEQHGKAGKADQEQQPTVL